MNKRQMRRKMEKMQCEIEKLRPLAEVALSLNSFERGDGVWFTGEDWELTRDDVIPEVVAIFKYGGLVDVLKAAGLWVSYDDTIGIPTMSYAEFKERLLQNPKVRKEYDALGPISVGHGSRGCLP